MKNRQIILLGITSIAAIGLVILLAGKTKKNRIMQRLDKIADEGYEIAEDIFILQVNLCIKKKNTRIIKPINGRLLIRVNDSLTIYLIALAL